MGNKESNESAAVKRQAEGGANPMYELLNLSGTGQMFYITQRAMVKKDYKELDEAIRGKVTPYLYNQGEGKMVPIAQLACLRNRDRPKSKQFPQIKELGEAAFNFVFEGSEFLAKLTEGLDPETSPHLFRECCWMVEKRGFVGETMFHVCFLMQTPTHLMLARRLLKHYPKLINDVYLSEEYYGENVLHMSVVAEDPTMVKYLLDQGIYFHEKCYGNFFCPEDQKPSRGDSLDHEYVDVCLKTNYAGYVYWGEYALCFAAVLNQEECFRLILSRGAYPDLIDTNGNTITHIMVVYDNMKMFDLAVESGASINILNNLQLTPLTVAAYLARKDMFFHIANIEREVYWQIGNVCCSAYPIEQLDTINSSNGEINTQSALNLIVFGPKIEHLDLIEGVVVDLLKTKWKTFIRRTFFRQMMIFTVFFCISLFCFVSRPWVPSHTCVPLSDNEGNATTAFLANSTTSALFDELISSTSEDYVTMSSSALEDEDYAMSFSPAFNTTAMMAHNATKRPSIKKKRRRPNLCDDGERTEYRDPCHLHTYDTTLKQCRLIGEIILVIWSVVYLVQAFREYLFLGNKLFKHTIGLCPSRIFFLLGCIILLAAVPFRLACLPVIEDHLVVWTMVFTGPYFLFFCRGFQKTGPFVTMIYRMMAKDLMRFLIIYIIFVLGFAQSYFVIYQSYEPDDIEENPNPMNSPVESTLQVFIMSLGVFGDTWDSLDDTNHAVAGKICCFVFLSLAFILLINLLIAMMGDTYTRIAEIKNEWMRQWARVVLIVERGIPPAERLKQQDLYSERMATGEKALVMKQSMSTEQLEEIRDIIEMKVSHRKNINRRRDKFGYDSGSLIGKDLAANANVIAPDAEDEENIF